MPTPVGILDAHGNLAHPKKGADSASVIYGIARTVPLMPWQDGSMRRLMLIGSAVVFLDVVFYAAITPLLPSYVDDLGLSKTSAGVLSGAYAAGTLVASLPAGFMAARLGPRRTLLAGLALLGAATAAASGRLPARAGGSGWAGTGRRRASSKRCCCQANHHSDQRRCFSWHEQ
jgi:MFS transporter